MNKYTINKISNGWLVDACLTNVTGPKAVPGDYMVFQQVFVSSIAEITDVIQGWETSGNPGSKKTNKVVSLVKDKDDKDAY